MALVPFVDMIILTSNAMFWPSDTVKRVIQFSVSELHVLGSSNIFAVSGGTSRAINFAIIKVKG